MGSEMCIRDSIWYLVQTNSKLDERVAELKKELQVQVALYEDLVDSSQQFGLAYRETTDLLIASQRALYEQERLFTKNNRNLAELALIKPGLVETRINRATKNRFNCIELATGTEISDYEKNDMCSHTVFKFD